MKNWPTYHALRVLSTFARPSPLCFNFKVSFLLYRSYLPKKNSQKLYTKVSNVFFLVEYEYVHRKIFRRDFDLLKSKSQFQTYEKVIFKCKLAQKNGNNFYCFFQTHISVGFFPWNPNMFMKKFSRFIQSRHTQNNVLKLEKMRRLAYRPPKNTPTKGQKKFFFFKTHISVRFSRRIRICS